MIDRIFTTIFRFLSAPVFAQSGPPQLSEIINIINKVFDWIFPAGVLIAVIMIITGGYMWIVSGGDPARKQQAQGTLTWAVLGLVLLFIFYGLLEVIVNFLM